MRFAFVAKHRHIWPVSWICEVLEVSRSGFHAWLERPASAREIQDAKLVAAIDKSFKASDRTYGARRVWRDVLEEGLACGLHRIERLMRQNALRARPKRRANQRTTANVRWSPTTSVIGISRRIARTGNGWPTSPTSGPRKAGSTSQSFWTCFPGAPSAGR
jgi:HTH-like domain